MRRREQRILIQYFTAWRLTQWAGKEEDRHKGGFSYTITLRDIKNAFPSISHAALDDDIERKYATGDERWLKTRYTDTRMWVEGAGGEWNLYKPGCGGL